MQWTIHNIYQKYDRLGCSWIHFLYPITAKFDRRWDLRSTVPCQILHDQYIYLCACGMKIQQEFNKPKKHGIYKVFKFRDSCTHLFSRSAKFDTSGPKPNFTVISKYCGPYGAQNNKFNKFCNSRGTCTHPLTDQGNLAR